ncbi:MBL fold metallo-hydrolase [Flammeovirga kamogawensis]|uniref:MBL fold metallo-hydrolase n=1 Tax=Flammeovirga kamogawensis TaxID=373891 RepID=A0ABX8H012_9BACT|nr:MBL fold metallo-hydrolase [Flammeovirga kamogawensis]MBB6459376.1 phosphoribosyl 1,2-cyclic phosphate phosphodiesterase [Flammeovirga kamogawensis]QWG08933.1 MBL fold metallo-hydrolase [Flammeovirga kamogawensis]TRX67224.1 MBL fold metallo-hydrolase [Flammeovirga kamogawensis]
MEITFLGTGTSQGVPIIGCDCEVCRSMDYRDKRLRTSIHIKTDDDQSIIIDSGPDFRQQVLRENIRQLDGLIFTHQHKDHTAGMDDIRGFYFLNNMKPIELYGTTSVFEQLKQEYSYIFAENKYPGVPSVNLNEIEKNKPFNIGKTTIEPVQVWHYKLPVMGFKINKFAYITDVNKIDTDQLEKLKGLDVLIIDALQRTQHISHFTLDQAVELCNNLQPKTAYLTHMGHKIGFHSDLEKELPDYIKPAFDGLVLSI